MFREVHGQVIQAKQFEHLLDHQFRRFSERVQNVIRSVILKSRRFCLAEVCYSFLKGGQSTADFFESPASNEGNWKIYDCPASMPCSTTVSMQINNFMKNFERISPVLLECVDKYFAVHNQHEKPPSYCVCSSAPHFFAASTFLGLYGYGWCIEQGVSCVRAIVKLVLNQLKATGGARTAQFKKSYVHILVKHWMQMVDVQSYLQMSLADEFFAMSNDPLWQATGNDEASGQFMLRIVTFAKNIMDGLLENLSRMPSMMKFMFTELKKGANEMFGADSKEARHLIEIIFFENMMYSVILNPKLYGLVTETFDVGMSFVSVLLKLVRFSMQRDDFQGQGNAVFDQVSQLEPFKQMKTQEILNKLMEMNVNPEDIEGVYARDIQNACKVSFHSLILSMNDMMMLSDIVKETIGKVEGPDDVKSRLQSSLDFTVETLSPHEMCEFWYESFTLPAPDVKPPKDVETTFMLPFMDDCALPELPPAEQKTLAHLINYLKDIPSSEHDPEDLMEFLDAKMKEAKDNEDNEMMAKTQAVKGKLEKLGKSGPEILQLLQATIKGNVSQQKSALTSSYDIQNMLSTVEAMEANVARMRSQLEPVLHSSIVASYTERRDILIRLSIISDDSPKLYTQIDHWYVYYIPLCRELIAFTQQFFSSPCPGVLRHLHTVICSLLPLAGFTTANDSVLHLVAADRHIATCSAAPLPEDSCYDAVASVLQRGLSISRTPLDKLATISQGIALLRELYEFENGEPATDDTTINVLASILAAAHPNQLASLRAYLMHFLTFRSDDPVVLEPSSARDLAIFERAVARLLETPVQTSS